MRFCFAIPPDTAARFVLAKSMDLTITSLCIRLDGGLE